MSDLHAALDIGTTRCKLAVWNDGLQLLDACATPQCTEHDMVALEWEHVQRCVDKQLRSLADYCQQHRVERLELGICGQVSSLLAWDQATARPLGPAALWLDQRCRDSVEVLRSKWTAEQLSQAIGCRLPLACNWLLVKLHHFMHSDEHTARRAGFVQLGDAVFHRLTGEFWTHASSQVSVVHQREASYARPLLQQLGYRPEQLPVIKQHGHAALVSEQAERLGLPPQTRVHVALADMYAGMNGFFLQQGEAGWQCNTSEIFAAPCSEQHGAPDLMSLWLDQQRIAYGSSVSGGLNVSWFMRQIGGNQTLEALTAAAAKIPAGSDGILYLPFLAGERAPYWDADLSSAFIGVRAEHSTAHLFRAMLEGVAYHKRALTALLPDLEQCKIAGGSSVNALWNQIRADVLQIPLQQVGQTEIALLGTLRHMATVCGNQDVHAQLAQQLAGAVFHPNPETAPVYAHAYASFCQAQDALSSVMHRLRAAPKIDLQAAADKEPAAGKVPTAGRESCHA